MEQVYLLFGRHCLFSVCRLTFEKALRQYVPSHVRDVPCFLADTTDLLYDRCL